MHHAAPARQLAVFDRCKSLLPETGLLDDAANESQGARVGNKQIDLVRT